MHTETHVEEKIEDGLKKVITTNTKIVTEPELVVEIEPEEYDIAEWFDEDAMMPEEVEKVTQDIQASIPYLKGVDDSQINVKKVNVKEMKKFIQEIEDEPGAFTHWVAVKKRVPVKYIPKYKNKVLKTVTTEEVTGEREIDTTDDIETGKAIYYASIEDA